MDSTHRQNPEDELRGLGIDDAVDLARAEVALEGGDDRAGRRVEGAVGRHAIAKTGERPLDLGDRRAAVAWPKRQPHLAPRDLRGGLQADAGGGEPRPVEQLAGVPAAPGLSSPRLAPKGGHPTVWRP